MAAYAVRLVTLLMMKWKHATIEQIAVSTVLAHAAQIDTRLQRLAFTSDIKTRNQLQQELQAFPFLKREFPAEPGDGEGSSVKRQRLVSAANSFSCFHCGKPGHKSFNCRLKRSRSGTTIGASRSGRVQQPNRDTDTLKASITCFRCRNVGHYASRCLSSGAGEKKLSDAGTSAQRRVDVCVVKAPPGVLRHAGEQYSFCFDSGAECSLIKESVSNKFGGKRFHHVVTMTGIGQTSIDSSLQILSEIEIDNIIIEVLFHVLPDHCLRNDLMVGREILNQRLAVYMTSDKIGLYKTKIVNKCSLLEPVNFEKINTDVPLERKQELISILNNFKKCFVRGVPKTRVDTDLMEIRLKDPCKVVHRRPYRLSIEEKEIVRNKVNELLAAQVIRPSSSPYASPVLLVKKKDGSDRMCVDYRRLNDNIIPDRFPLPLISDQINRLRGCHYFTTLDMASGFHQIPVHPSSVERTAFVTPEGQYEFLAMPFGLRNAPSVFQRAVIKVLGEHAHSYVVVYMDDLLVVAGTVDEALDRLRNILETLSKAGFSFNFDKCSFLKESVEYLGFQVEKGKVRPNSRKIEALTALPPPKTVTQLRQFIGLASYFRQFIPGFSQIMAPLYRLTSSKRDLDWKPSLEIIRQKIISTLTSAPVLMIFDPDYPVELHTDASSVGYGAILIQKNSNTIKLTS